jgi:hypothetical protein
MNKEDIPKTFAAPSPREQRGPPGRSSRKRAHAKRREGLRPGVNRETSPLEDLKSGRSAGTSGRAQNLAGIFCAGDLMGRRDGWADSAAPGRERAH